ncbi:MAG: hypothetical protein WBO43_16155 [Gemmatimonadota bacterium]
MAQATTSPSGSTVYAPPESDRAARIFGRLRFTFETGLEANPGAAFVGTYRLAGRLVRLRVLGSKLAQCAHRPIAHLAEPIRVSGDGVGTEPVELTIDLWDESAVGLACAGCVSHEDLTLQSQVTASHGGRFVVEERAQLVTAFDRAGGRIVGWVGDASRLTRYELGRPLHSHLLLWHRDRGVQAVHSGLVARDGQGVLFGGPGGSGKSTVSLTCLGAGLDYLADDYVGLEPDGTGGYRGYSLYSSTAVNPAHMRRCFPHLVEHEIPGVLPHEDKSLVLLAELFPDQLPQVAHVRAVALPRVVDSEQTTIRPATAFDAVLRLAPSSLMALPHSNSGAIGLEVLTEFVSSIPTFWLELGRDLPQIPMAVERILAEAMA